MEDEAVEERTFTLAEVRKTMSEIAAREGLRLFFLKANRGRGGYNYGGSANECIMLAPFKKGHKGDKIGCYELEQDCDNPVECMFITFFHELAHCRLYQEVPHALDGFSWNDTSRFQYELWITMLGVEYAYKNYKIKFSDQSVKWLLNENMTYIHNDWKDFGNGITVKKANTRSYSIVAIPKSTFKGSF